MKPTPLGDARPALAVPTQSTARRWRAGASLAALALIAAPLVAAPASATETEPAPSAAPAGEPTTTEPATQQESEPSAEPMTTAADAPVFTGTIEVDGVAAVGSVLTLDETGGTWSPEPESKTYSWLLSDDALLDASDVPVEGATDASVTLLPAHLGKYVIGTVAATAAGATSEPVAASTVEPVAAGDLAAGYPTISGTVQVDSLLTAHAGTWPEGTDIAYRWVINDTVVATTPTYTPPAVHATKLLRLSVLGTKEGYVPKTAQSQIVQIVKAAFTTTTPKINGTVVVGGLVGATTGHFSPEANLTYRWNVNGTPIGATSRNFRIPSRLHGDELTVTVTGSRDGYRPQSVTSAPSVVSKPFGRASYPTISGTLRVGQTLTADRGIWSPTPSVVTYQWRAEGRPIPGATSRTYKLTRAEHGKNISVEIVGRKYAYLPTTRRSSATDTVKWPVGISTPDVTTQPTRYLLTTPGRIVTLKGAATGGSLRYQWQRWTPANPTWTNMSGQTSSTLRFTASTAHELNRFRLVVSNMAGKDTSNRTFLWIQSSMSAPFSAYQWFSLWNYNAVVSESFDDVEGYLAAGVFVCAAPGHYATGDLSVQFVGNNGKVYPGAGQEQPDHISKGVPLDADGCGIFGVYSDAPQSVRVGGRWRVTDRSDGQVYHQYVKYERPSLAEAGGTPSARALAGSDAAASQIGSPTGFVPVVEAPGTLTD